MSDNTLSQFGSYYHEFRRAHPQPLNAKRHRQLKRKLELMTQAHLVEPPN